MKFVNPSFTLSPSVLPVRPVGFPFSIHITNTSNQNIEYANLEGDANGLHTEIIAGEIYIKGTPVNAGDYPFVLVAGFGEQVSAIQY